MDERLTDRELTEIRERAEKAVYAPWRIGKQSPNGLYNVGSTDGLLTAQTTNEANAAFIANAREDIPKLLAEIKRLREDLTTAYDVLAELQTNLEGDEFDVVTRLITEGDSE